jgi:hypothetical protein
MGELKFARQEELEAWLKTQPREVGVVLGARAALRVAPWDESHKRDIKYLFNFRSLVFSIFFVSALTRFIVTYPKKDLVLRKSKQVRYLFTSGVDTGVCLAAAFIEYIAASEAAGSVTLAQERVTNASDMAAAAREVGMLGRAKAAASDADAAAVHSAAIAAATYASSDVAWVAVSHDANFITDGGTASALADWPLWPGGPPEWATENWARLRAALPQGENWEVWTRWYEDLLAGRLYTEAHHLVFATVPEELWKTPAAANAWIKQQLATLIARPADCDFFLSYSKKDELFAKFVDEVLRRAGCSVFAMFRDIPVGSEFVREMNRGLVASRRVVALLSPHYIASDHCQAEWNTAYAGDASGAKRKLVPLLIENADLTPLARTRVYQSLIGLSRADASKAILDAVGHAGPAPPPNSTWPGAEVLGAMTSSSDAERRAEVIRVPKHEAAEECKAREPRFDMKTPNPPNCFGREKELAQIWKHFFRPGDADANAAKAAPPPLRNRRVLIHAGPGFGKTTLAAHFAHSHQADFAEVWWIPSQDPTTLLAAVMEIGSQAEDANAPTPDSAGCLLAKHFQNTTKPCLLVFDNVGAPCEDASLQEAAIGAGASPQGTERLVVELVGRLGSNVRVLMTSRRAGWDDGAEPILMGGLGLKAAAKFLRKRTGRHSDVEGSMGFSITISAVSRPLNSSRPSIVIFQRIAVLRRVGHFLRRKSLTFVATQLILRSPAGSSTRSTDPAPRARVRCSPSSCARLSAATS